ncbi:LPXTG cell wall anchor domain-containing protein [Gemmiger sp.]|uniref:LPXTG cell wall anchor domain-containing protein n=1 Tax=Gemmiger sp. TaxID=2049027 RepID=UPI003A93605F
MKPRNTLMQRIAALALAALTVSGGAVYADEAAQPGFAVLTMPQSAPEVSAIPQTGDSAAPALWLAAMALALAGMTVTYYKKKTR